MVRKSIHFEKFKDLTENDWLILGSLNQPMTQTDISKNVLGRKPDKNGKYSRGDINQIINEFIKIGFIKEITASKILNYKLNNKRITSNKYYINTEKPIYFYIEGKTNQLKLNKNELFLLVDLFKQVMEYTTMPSYIESTKGIDYFKLIWKGTMDKLKELYFILSTQKLLNNKKIKLSSDALKNFIEDYELNNKLINLLPKLMPLMKYDSFFLSTLDNMNNIVRLIV